MGLCYRDNDDEISTGVLVRDGVFVEPDIGWCVPGRTYRIVEPPKRESEAVSSSSVSISGSREPDTSNFYRFWKIPTNL